MDVVRVALIDYLSEARAQERRSSTAEASHALARALFRTLIVQRRALERSLALRGWNPELREAHPLSATQWEPFASRVLMGATQDQRAAFQRLGMRALRSGVFRVSTDVGVGISFQLDDPRAANWMRTRGAELVTRINETTRDRMSAVLTRGVEEGWSYQKLALELREDFGFSWRRSVLIARTETANAFAEGTLLGARKLRDAGLRVVKQWLVNEPDDDDCIANGDTDWLDVDDVFPSGHMRPPVHPNCECDLVFRTVEDERVDRTKDDYRGGHRPAGPDTGARIDDIETVMPDYYEHPEYYAAFSAPVERETRDAIMRARGDPDARITVYRSVPRDVEEINPGDWVTVSRTYARDHGEEGWRVLSKTVPARELWASGDAAPEFGWHPDDARVDPPPKDIPGVMFDAPNIKDDGGSVTASAWIGRQLVDAGSIYWTRTSKGEFVVTTIAVNPLLRRRGIATELWRRARAIVPDLQHALPDSQSPAAKAWIAGMDRKLGPRVDRVEVPTIPDIPDEMFEQQAEQLPKKGPPGVSYFKGEMDDGKYIDVLMYRTKDGKLAGILYHYPFDFGDLEQKGNVNTLVHPDFRRQGIGTQLLRDAIQRWNIDLTKQKYTRAGAALANTVQDVTKIVVGPKLPPLPKVGAPGEEIDLRLRLYARDQQAVGSHGVGVSNEAFVDRNVAIFREDDLFVKQYATIQGFIDAMKTRALTVSASKDLLVVFPKKYADQRWAHPDIAPLMALLQKRRAGTQIRRDIYRAAGYTKDHVTELERLRRAQMTKTGPKEPTEPNGPKAPRARVPKYAPPPPPPPLPRGATPFIPEFEPEPGAPLPPLNVVKVDPYYPERGYTLKYVTPIPRDPTEALGVSKDEVRVASLAAKPDLSTAKKANAWLQTRFNLISTPRMAHFADFRAVEESLHELDRLSRLYPNAAAMLRGIDMSYVGGLVPRPRRQARDFDPSEGAHVGWQRGSNQQGMGLNPDHFRDPQKLLDKLQDQMGKGHWSGMPSDGVPALASSITHEFGHVLHNYLEYNADVRLKVIDADVGPSQRKEDIVPQTIRDVTDKYRTYFDRSHARSVSAYAQHSWFEGFAESFRELNYEDEAQLSESAKKLREMLAYLDARGAFR